MISVLVVSNGDSNLSRCILGIQVDLAWLAPVLRFARALARLGLASVRLYYTVPYNFWYRCLFRAPVLVLPADTVRRTSLQRYVLR